MTFNEKLRQVLNTKSEEQNKIDDMIMFAYWAGREAEATELCDRAEKIWFEQAKRAINCRYSKMACKVVGLGDKQKGGRFLYSENYGFKFSADCGGEEWIEENEKAVQENG